MFSKKQRMIAFFSPVSGSRHVLALRSVRIKMRAALTRRSGPPGKSCFQMRSSTVAMSVSMLFL